MKYKVRSLDQIHFKNNTDMMKDAEVIKDLNYNIEIFNIFLLGAIRNNQSQISNKRIACSHLLRKIT